MKNETYNKIQQGKNFSIQKQIKNIKVIHHKNNQQSNPN